MTGKELDPPIQDALKIVEEVIRGGDCALARAKLQSHAEEFASEFIKERRDRFLAFMNSTIAFINSIEMNRTST